MRVLLLICGIFFASHSYASLKYVMMMSPESSSEMPYQKVDKYCHNLKSSCEVKTSGECDEKIHEKWAVPAKEELDQFSDRTKSARFVWTKSRLFAVGDGLPVVYRLSKGGSYGPSLGQNHRVRCVKWTSI